MQLKALEILGCVAGFIPGVSTVTGVIKAYVYYKRSKSKKADKEKVEVTAQKVAGKPISDSRIQHLSRREKAISGRLMTISLLEMLPFANIVAALSEVTLLDELNDARAFKQSTERQIQKLHHYYGVTPIQDKEKEAFMNKVLFLLHNIQTPGNLPSVRQMFSKNGYDRLEINNIKRKLYSMCYSAAMKGPITKQPGELLTEMIKVWVGQKYPIIEWVETQLNKIISQNAGLLTGNEWVIEHYRRELNAYQDVVALLLEKSESL